MECPLAAAESLASAHENHVFHVWTKKPSPSETYLPQDVRVLQMEWDYSDRGCVEEYDYININTFDVQHWRLVARQAHRVLKPGGRFHCRAFPLPWTGNPGNSPLPWVAHLFNLIESALLVKGIDLYAPHRLPALFAREGFADLDIAQHHRRLCHHDQVYKQWNSAGCLLFKDFLQRCCCIAW